MEYLNFKSFLLLFLINKYEGQNVIVLRYKTKLSKNYCKYCGYLRVVDKHSKSSRKELMEQNDKDSGLNWTTEEIKNDLMRTNKIVEEQNIEELFNLEDNSDFSIALHEILANRYERDSNSLNEIQLNLFLCTHIENAGQADSILSFLQEWFPQYSTKVINSLNAIGAKKSAEIIRQAVDILPKDGSWFFETADESKQELMSKLDRDFSNYPDGKMTDLYREYAESNRNDI